MTQVPLTYHARAISLFLEGFGYGDFRCRYATCRIWKQHPSLAAAHSRPDGQTSCQKCCSAGCAHRRTDVKLTEFQTLLSHLVQIGCGNGRMAIHAQISVSEIVTKYNDDVGLRSGNRSSTELKI